MHQKPQILIIIIFYVVLKKVVSAAKGHHFSNGVEGHFVFGIVCSSYKAFSWPVFLKLAFWPFAVEYLLKIVFYFIPAVLRLVPLVFSKKAEPFPCSAAASFVTLTESASGVSEDPVALEHDRAQESRQQCINKTHTCTV